MQNNLRKYKFRVHGMHCASCEILIEQKLRQIPGIQKININHASGKAKIFAIAEPDIKVLQDAIKDDGYAISHWGDQVDQLGDYSSRDFFEIGAVFLIVVALYLILKQFDIFPALGVSENMSYGFVFLIGLVAATSSCLAVTGGLLLAVSSKYHQDHPELSGFAKFKPHFYFNIGRVLGYTVLGGLIGWLGSVLTLSPRASGIVTIFVSVIMVVLGFQLLGIFKWSRHLQPKMPKFIAHRIHGMKGSFTLGAATFFLPCGFTQALQLYVLSQGDFTTGALTMLIFSLGTLPALLSLGVLTSFLKGAFQRIFIRFAGVVVIILGMFNINSGMALSGVSLSGVFDNGAGDSMEKAQVIDGKQVVSMKVDGFDYSPNQFTVKKAVPVEWRIDGESAGGCAKVILMPDMGIYEYLKTDEDTIITFVPEEVGTFEFNCSMWMATPNSKFIVVE